MIGEKPAPAALLILPSQMKAKAGSGGLEDWIMADAQKKMEAQAEDFTPIANEQIQALEDAITKTISGELSGEEMVEALIYPAMQLKAQGTMFKYPVITEICNTLVNFLDTLGEDIDDDALDVLTAHQKSISAILHHKLSGNGGDAGHALRNALLDVCTRYYKTLEK